MPVDHRGLGTYYESLSVVELLLEYHHLIMLIINWFYKLVYKVASLDTQLECILVENMGLQCVYSKGGHGNGIGD